MANEMESRPDVLRDKSFAFAVRAVRAFQFLQESKREFVLSKQLVRYWLDLLAATDYLTAPEASSLQDDAFELLKLLTNSIKTAKVNLSS